MRAIIDWKDNVVQYPNRYQETDLGEGYKQLVKAYGEVIQQGTQMSASNFNEMDQKGYEGIAMGLIVCQYIHQLSQKVEGLEGVQIETTMTNGKEYPFNNSKKTVQISPSRNTKDYSVEVEVLEKTGNGGVGDIVITEKLVNGFKIEFTGGAQAVKVNCIVRGGI